MAESEPLVPVKIAVPDPVAELAAENVIVSAIPGFIWKLVALAVTPAGKPVRLMEINPEKPFTAVADSVTVWLAPGGSERDVGLTDKVNDCGPSTVSEKAAECESAPLVAVAVTETLLTGVAPVATERVTVCDPPPEKVRDAGDAVTPEGSPLKETETLPENEPVGVTRNATA